MGLFPCDKKKKIYDPAKGTSKNPQKFNTGEDMGLEFEPYHAQLVKQIKGEETGEKRSWGVKPYPHDMMSCRARPDDSTYRGRKKNYIGDRKGRVKQNNEKKNQNTEGKCQGVFDTRQRQ